MAAFEKIKNMNDRQIQDWLRKVGRHNVISFGIALLGADDEVLKRVFRNMSKSAGTILADTIDKNRKLNFEAKDIALNTVKLEKLF